MTVEKSKYAHKLDNSKSIGGKQRFVSVVLMSFFVLFFSQNGIYAQSRFEVGPSGGVTYYMGDLNAGVPFADPMPAFGGLIRYAFDDRIAVKGAVTLAGLKGTYDSKKDGILPVYGWVNGSPGNFRRNIVSVALTGEINLFSYDHKYISSAVFTPYISFGFGGMGYNRLTEVRDSIVSKPYVSFSLPLGVGVKYKFSKWIRVGAEWSFVKLFVDDVDNYKGLGNAFHNNDWFSVFKIYITFGFLRRKSECFGLCTHTLEDRRNR